MLDIISTFAKKIWAWLNTEQYAGALSVLLTITTIIASVIGWVWRRKTKADTPPPGGNNVSASNGGVGAGGSMTGNTIIHNHGTIIHNHGPTLEQTAALAGVRDLSPASEAQAAAPLAQYGVTSRAALSSFFAILREQEVPPEQLPAKLAEIALRHREALERLTALELDSPDDPQRLAEARAAIEQGDHARADQLLATIEAAQAAARAKAQTAADALARRQAATRAERGRLSALRLDYRAAAEHFHTAASLLPTGDTEARGGYLTESADALQQHGAYGDNNALHAAISRYRDALPPRDSHPALWARVQNSLGSALATLGEREKGSERLYEALVAFRNALLVRTQEFTPLNWAATQHNIGNTLMKIGEREKEPKEQIKQLNEAVHAFQNALRRRTQEGSPLDWATTQNSLGATFKAIGEREKNQEEKVSKFKKSVDSFQNALSKRTRELTPFDWAATQSNLGVALRKLAECQKSPKNKLDNLKKAINAFQNALLEYTYDRTPFAWAATHTNMANALHALAELTDDLGAAKQAVTAHEAALEMFTHLNTPHYIEGTSNNLALARATLAKLEGDADDSPPHQ